MPQWRVYYEDGSSKDDESTSLEDLPTRGVIGLLQKSPENSRILITRWDFYRFEDKGWYWWGCDLFGLWDYLTRPGLKKVLFGRTVSDETYQAIYKKMASDSAFPKPCKTHPNENGGKKW